MATIHIRPGEGRHYRMIDGDHVAKAAVQDACGVGSLRGHRACRTDGAPALDGTSYDIEPGGVVVLPAGTPTTFGVVSESARFLAVTSGDGAGKFSADFASSVPAGQPVEDAMEPSCR